MINSGMTSMLQYYKSDNFPNISFKRLAAPSNDLRETGTFIEVFSIVRCFVLRFGVSRVF